MAFLPQPVLDRFLAMPDMMRARYISNPSPPPSVLVRSIPVYLTQREKVVLAHLAMSTSPRDQAEIWEMFSRMALDDFTMRAVRMEWGNYSLERNLFTGGWSFAPIRGRDMLRATIGRNPIYLDRPPILPFTNVDMNEGDDNDCVGRFLALANLPTACLDNPAQNHLDRILGECERFGVRCTLFDLLGNEMGATHEFTINSTHLRAVIGFNHVYPLTEGEVPRLPSAGHHAVHWYDDMQEMVQRASDAGAVVFARDDDFFIGSGPMAGVHHRRKDDAEADMNDVWEPWMSMLLDEIEPHAWDPETLRLMHQGTLALMYFDERLDPSRLPMQQLREQVVTIDKSACYFSALYWLLTNGYLCEPASVFTVWEQIDEHLIEHFDGGDAEDNCFYLISGDPIVLQAHGIRSNLLPWFTVNLLRGNSIPIVLLRRLRLHRTNLPHLYDIVMGCVGDRKKEKAYVYVNGVMGKIRKSTSTLLYIPEDDVWSNAYYAHRYGMRRDEVFMTHTDYAPFIRNKYHVACMVIHAANYIVLEKLLHIRSVNRGAELVRIMTDSLSFTVRSLRTPFASTMAYIKDLVLLPPDRTEPAGAWKQEVWRSSFMRVMPMRLLGLNPAVELTTSLLPDVNFMALNRSFIGPPGTGKTVQMMALNPHLATTFTNAGVQRLRADGAEATTLHKMFGLFQEVKGAHLRLMRSMRDLFGKLIGVDEVQTLSPSLISLLVQAQYESVKVGMPIRYIFTMDFDQLSPIGHEPLLPDGNDTWPMPSFLGQITKLTHDYRNDLPLQRVRDYVKENCEIPREGYGVKWASVNLETMVTDSGTTEFPLVHLTMTHATRKRVNEACLKLMKKKFGDAGVPYLVKSTKVAKRLYKGQILTKVGRCLYAPDDDQPIHLTAKQQEQFLDLGYARTVDSTIGTTIREPYGIWDMNHMHMNVRRLYTAVTRGVKLEQITCFTEW